MRYWGDDWENDEGCRYANSRDQTLVDTLNLLKSKNYMFMCRDGSVYTSDVGGYRANEFGLYDVLGNVLEWTEDCCHDSYAGAPTTGSAWTTGGECGLRVLRGGSWVDIPGFHRAASRYGFTTGSRNFNAGFRVARTLFTP